MHIHCSPSSPLPVSAALIQLLEAILAQSGNFESSAVTLNFRDSTYSADKGGFHPVEIRIESTGEIAYITDFAYVGRPPFAELAKEIDFDFSLGLFQHFGRDFPTHDGYELYAIWEGNFLDYYNMGVFTVTVTWG